MVLTLRDSGVFTHLEWAEALGAELSRAPAGGSESQYHHWLAALENLLAAKSAASPEALRRHRLAWRHAASRTPHGEPITLITDDFQD